MSNETDLRNAPVFLRSKGDALRGRLMPFASQINDAAVTGVSADQSTTLSLQTIQSTLDQTGPR